MKPFVIFALHRTGSTNFVTALNGHPEIECADAIFSHKAKKFGIELSDPIRSMDRWLSDRGNVPFVGFKLMLHQSPEVMREIARRQFPVIFLTRSNELARHSSQLIARKTGKRSHRSYFARLAQKALKKTTGSYNTSIGKHLISGGNRLVRDRSEKVEFHRKRFQRMRQKTESLMSNAQTVLAEHNCETLHLDYPMSATQEGLHAALRFLGAMEMDLVSTTKKMNPPNIVERFTNPDEVLQFLEDESLQQWAREGTA